MIHYVLFKFKEGSDLDALETRLNKAFKELSEVLPYFNDPHVYRNIVERDVNMDIMATMRLDKEENLRMYLDHPIHVALGNDIHDFVELRRSIDCAE